MPPPNEVIIQTIVNESVEQGLVPPEYREEAVNGLSREMSRVPMGPSPTSCSNVRMRCTLLYRSEASG
jgi:hypothetical protein